MTTENQIAIAEACDRISGKITPFHKDNFNSIDSMQQAVLAQDEEFQKEFAYRLFLKAPSKKIADDFPVIMFHQLTVTDWQESFIETLKQLGRLK